MHWLLILGGSLMGGVLLGRPQAFSPDGEQVAFLAGGLLLEVSAPVFPGFGFASLAPALWLGLVCRHPQLGWLALLGAMVGLLLRSLRSSNPGRYGLWEALGDFQPLALALGVSRALGQPLLAPLLWWLLWWFQPAFLGGLLEPERAADWSLLRSRFLGKAAAAALLAWVASGLDGQPFFPALLALALASLHQSAGWVVRAFQADLQEIEARKQQRGLQAREKGLDRVAEDQQATRLQQRKTQTELEVRLETYQLVDEMLEAIPQRLVFEGVADLILQRLQRRFQVTNVVLFWQREELVPVAWLTPHADRLGAALLVQLQEPEVQRAWQNGRIETQQGEASGQPGRLFPEDRWVVAVPLPGRGVIYLGHPFIRPLKEEEVHFLQVMARHTVLALDAAAWYQTLQISLQREAATAARNEALVQQLALVIDGVTQLIRLRDPQAMLESTATILEPVVPHQAFFARAGQWQVAKGTGSGDGLPGLADRVCQTQLPLLLEDPPQLGVPLLSERGTLGALVLTREAGHPFTREDQDILLVLSYQLGSALMSAQLYAELQHTHEALRASQAQLVQSSKMAAVGQLAGGVAHELNTPLGAVALAIEGAQMNLESKPDRAQTRLQRAGKAVQQMKEIVSKLLFYSRDARTGRRETNLNHVIEDTLQLVGHQLMLDQIEVVQELADLPHLLGNANELQQVFTNLILNARDAMLTPGAMGKRLHLSTGTWEGGCWAKVRDQGTGMPAEVAERIFEPFFTTKEVGKGTGLGLSVTAQLVQQHGGTVRVQSQPGQGTEFEVRLPLQPPKEA